MINRQTVLDAAFQLDDLLETMGRVEEATWAVMIPDDVTPEFCILLQKKLSRLFYSLPEHELRIETSFGDVVRSVRGWDLPHAVKLAQQTLIEHEADFVKVGPANDI